MAFPMTVILYRFPVLLCPEDSFFYRGLYTVWIGNYLPADERQP